MNVRIEQLKLEFNDKRNKVSFDEAIKSKDNPKAKFHWICIKNGDEWETSMYSRLIRGRDCLYCANQKVNTRNCLATTHSHLVKEWDSENQIKPSEVVAGNTKDEIIWRCSKNNKHTWKASINSRARKNPTGCPYCSHRKASIDYNLETQYPEIAMEYDSVINKNKPNNELPGSSKSVNWKCKKCSYLWKSEIRKRTQNKERCPQCSETKATLTNCLAVTNMNLMLQWDFEKNNLNPFLITLKKANSQSVHWICEKGHKYTANIYNRTKSKNPTGCPFCSGKQTSIEKSIYSNKFLKKEWDEELNQMKGYDIKKISLKSSKAIHWICKLCKYKWLAIPANRTGKNETGCPECSHKNNKKGTSIEENKIRFALKKIFPTTYESPKKINSVKFRNTLAEIDIWIEEINLGIEYDPHYTHKGKEKTDREKTDLLNKNGYQLIRVRQIGLPKINDADVYFSEKSNTNDIVREILKKILNLRQDLPKTIKLKINTILKVK